AAQTAAGVPRPVLHRALLLETALPLAPALLLAGVGGLAFGTGYGYGYGYGYGTMMANAPSLPWTALLVPPAAYTACLLASATALPLLSRSADPSRLRYA
ncbi:ABC transporter permease, partial [Streptomyces sp. NPDC058632]